MAQETKAGDAWTPGPWTVHEDPTSNYLFEIVAKTPRGLTRPVARVVGGPFAEQRQANAALLAAAPQLVDALREEREEVADALDGAVESMSDPDGSVLDALDAAYIERLRSRVATIDAALAAAGAKA